MIAQIQIFGNKQERILGAPLVDRCVTTGPSTSRREILRTHFPHNNKCALAAYYS